MCSGRNVELVRGIGADHVVDYERSDFTSDGTQYDLIIDLVGNRSLRAYRRALAPHGTLRLSGGGGGSIIGPMARLAQALVVNLFVATTCKPVFATPGRAKLDRLRELAEAGSLTPAIERTYPLSDAPEAVRRLIGRARPGQDRPHRRAGELMSYEERNVWVFLVVAVLFYAAYVVVVLSRAQDAPLTEVAYVGPYAVVHRRRDRRVDRRLASSSRSSAERQLPEATCATRRSTGSASASAARSS